VLWGANDDVLVLPVFWSPKIFTRNFSMVVNLPDLCLQMILDHLAKTEVQIRSLIYSAIMSNPSETSFSFKGLHHINISILLKNKAMLWMSSDLNASIPKIDVPKCDPLQIAE